MFICLIRHDFMNWGSALESAIFNFPANWYKGVFYCFFLFFSFNTLKAKKQGNYKLRGCRETSRLTRK